MALSSHWARTHIACLWPIQVHCWQSPNKEPALSTVRMICAKSSLGNKRRNSVVLKRCSPLWPPPGPCVVWCDSYVCGVNVCSWGLFPVLWPSMGVWHWQRVLGALSLADTRAASDQLLLKDSYLSLGIYLPDFMGKGGSNKDEAIKRHKVNQCLSLLLFPCWLSWWSVITSSGENLWMLDVQNIARDSGLSLKEKLLEVVWKKPAKYLCIASLDKQVALWGLTKSAGHHLG